MCTFVYICHKPVGDCDKVRTVPTSLYQSQTACVHHTCRANLRFVREDGNQVVDNAHNFIHSLYLILKTDHH